ncbi:FimD/PapC C-terminal domain-containing protein [Enterobacter ludwigii]|uniref:FimD/PapC C-terminal domain-containing protein n=1 Tax=Enterobacter ludwigii TaxID=299767 RepID=UPI00273E445A|nr:FimD/PapC C-terminal domain-containing protein [Enterobacter ludwigii]MDP5163384.1 FimD/PapC C-terminal domain-containing protein [Enterobacter ludwigii]
MKIYFKNFRRLLSGGLILFCSVSACNAGETQGTVQTNLSSYPDTSTQEIYLDVWLNGVSQGVYPFTLRNDSLMIASEKLKKIGLTGLIINEKIVDLMKIKELNVQYSPELQLVKLVTEHIYTNLERKIYGVTEEKILPVTSDSGAVFNYTISNWAAKHTSTSSIFSELRGFNDLATFSNSMYTDYTSGQNKSLVTRRLDTRLASTWQENNVIVHIGDTVSDTDRWTPSVRYAGVMLSNRSNTHSVRSLLTPLEFEYNSVSSSEVNLFIDGNSKIKTEVPGGPFTLHTLPSISGFSNAELWVTDKNTNEKYVINKPIYFTTELLRENFSEWSLGYGYYRDMYGMKSFAYSNDALFYGVFRHGINSKLTLESDLQASSGLFNTGLGIITSPHPYLGVISSNISYSDFKNQNGSRNEIGHRWSNKLFNTSISYETKSKDYRDLQSWQGFSFVKKNVNYNIGMGSNNHGYYMFSYSDLQSFSSVNYESYTFTWQKGFSDWISVYLSQRMIKGSINDIIYYGGITVPLGPMTTSINTNYTNGDFAHTLSAGNNMHDENGFLWRGNIKDKLGYQSASGEIEYAGDYSKFTASADTNGFAYLSMSGALALIDSTIYAGRPIKDAFASVSTSGVPGVPVYVDNRLAGVTDNKGFLLIPELISFQKNKISIDTLSLPYGYQITEFEKTIVPGDRTGSIIQFGIHRDKSAILKLTDNNGFNLPQGADVTFNGKNNEFTVGFDGEAYVTGLKTNNKLNASWFDNKKSMHVTCNAEFSYLDTNKYEINFIPVICK